MIFQVPEGPSVLRKIALDELLRRTVFLVLGCSHHASEWESIISHPSLVLDGTTVRVTTSPPSLKEKAIKMLENHVHLTPRDSTHVLHILEVENQFLWSLLPREFDFSTVVPPSASKHTSRAYFKMQEVVHRLGIALDRRICALDVGASPGGWTEYLSSMVEHVVAVDPGPLHELILTRPNVTHIRKRVEVAGSEIQLHMPVGGYHLCVCDINVEPRAAAAVLLGLLPFLRQDCIVVLTLKLTSRKVRKLFVSFFILIFPLRENCPHLHTILLFFSRSPLLLLLLLFYLFQILQRQCQLRELRQLRLVL